MTKNIFCWNPRSQNEVTVVLCLVRSVLYCSNQSHILPSQKLTINHHFKICSSDFVPRVGAVSLGGIWLGSPLVPLDP